MSELNATAALAASTAKDTDLVALKLQVDRLKGDLTPAQSKQKKLRKACTEFEAVFISKMWEQMRNTIPKDGILHSPQEDMYRSMFDRDFSEKLAADGGIGLGDMLYGQLKGKLGGAAKTSAAGGATTLDAATGKTASAPAPGKSDLSMPARNTQSQSPAQSTAQITAQATQTSEAVAPKRPASVPGEVMAEVENLARRIEAAFDQRQQAVASATKYDTKTTAVQASANANNVVANSRTALQLGGQNGTRAGGYTLGARISGLGIPLGRNLAKDG